MKYIISMMFVLGLLSSVFALDKDSIAVMNTLGISSADRQVVESNAKNFDDEIVLVSGFYRGLFPNNFSMEFDVIETRDNVENDQSKGKSYVKIKEDGNAWVSLSIITNDGGQPARRILQDGTTLWFHQKGASRSIRISPAQKLLGGASYSDVSSTNYFYDYKVIARETVDIGDTEAYKLTLEPRSKGVAYAEIQYWVSRSDFRPIKSEFFARSGRKLKSMYFRNYKPRGSRIISTEWVIIDGLNEKLVTYIRLGTVQIETLPERYYSYSALPDLP